tara:strand:- start:611 stop:1864 length:1254 start_codon:yes stop_codon:yes gene_type:complete
MKKIILILFCIPLMSQEIKWNSVPYEAINPDELLTKGIIELDNGDKTSKANLYIDFGQETIFYKNLINNAIFSIYKEDFAKISVDDFKDGEMVRDGEFYGDVGDEIGASLRKGLYDLADLNILNITSVEKEGFFNRRQPKFEIKNNELDVSNKGIVTCKLLAIRPGSIEYLDSEGDLWLKGDRGARIKTAGQGEDKASKREEKKEARKQARILNIRFGEEYFLNTRELYDYFYNDYKNNFYASRDQFKNDFVGMDLIDLLSSWGPYTEQFQIDNNNKLFVWTFTREITELESTTVAEGNIINKLISSSTNSSSGSITSQYGINTNASKYNLGGYGSVMNSYNEINESSFLNYYSKNIIKQYGSQQSIYMGQTTSTSVKVDDTKKIGLVVNNLGKINKVIVNNFFSEPYYGVTINFYE